MKYLLAGIVVLIFSVIYLVGYKLNSKIKIDCERKDCEGCKFMGCIHRKEEE